MNSQSSTVSGHELGTLEKIGQLFMPAAFINDREEDIQKLEHAIREYHIGGLCFFHSRASAATNFEGNQQVVRNEDSLGVLKNLIRRYQKAAPTPLLIAMDAEWGLAMRVENTPQYPYAITLGAMRGNENLVFTMARNIGRDCREAGIHWNFAPVADINNNPENPVIGYRSFGEDKSKVSSLVMNYAKGLSSMGILNCIKHFPGHGDTGTDSHLGLPKIDKSMEELLDKELHPFMVAISSGVDAVMVGHLSVPAVSGGLAEPVSVSRAAIRETLREKFGFRGVVVSDALNMHAVSGIYPEKGLLEWKAFDAGNDILCFSENLPEGIAMIAERASAAQIAESFRRVRMLKEKAFAPSVSSRPEFPNPGDLNGKLAKETITFYKGTPGLLAGIRREGFTGVALSRNREMPFFESIQKVTDFPFYSTSQTAVPEMVSRLPTGQNIVLALVPPRVKPHQNFHLSEQELDLIKWLLKQNKVVLYLFGNPYVLNIIDVQKAVAVIVAYQDFREFQEEAAHHFLGNITARGVLPVTVMSP